MGARLLWAALLLALLPGCTQLHRSVVKFDGLSDCPKQTVETLQVQQSELGPLTETQTLECTLQFLRGTHHLTLRRSALASRVCLHLAERSPEQDKREKLASEGVRFAETALALGADGDGAVHYYLAVNLGLAVRDHMTLAVENLVRLESELRRAVVLSPDIDDGGPLRVLGMLYLRAPPWPTGIGDGDKALELLKQAVEKHPNHPLNHLFYAQAIWELEEDNASDRVKTELATGMKLLKEGRWGYNQEPWEQEFAALKKQIDEASP